MGYSPFTTEEYRRYRGLLTALALQTSNAPAIAQQLIETLRSARVIVPSGHVIDRCCVEALARGTRLFYQRLTGDLMNRAAQDREEAGAVLLGRDMRTVASESSREYLQRSD